MGMLSKKKDNFTRKKECVRRVLKTSDTFALTYLTLRNVRCEDQRLAHSGRNRRYANEFSPFESTTLFKLCAGDFPSRWPNAD